MFLELFEKIEFPPDKPWEFPLDFILPGNSRNYFAFAKNKLYESPEKYIDCDYITIPRCYNIDYDYKKLEQDATRLILYAGFDRNIVVYDEENDESYVSKRLIALMQETQKRNSGRFDKLTDIFVAEGTSVEVVDDVKVHYIDRESWKDIKDFYNQVWGIFPNDKKNLVIGLSLVKNDSLVMPFNNHSAGLAILDNRCVLLGSF